MYFPKEEYEARWSRLHAEMERRGFETAVIWQRTGGGFDRAGDVWYLSNYASLNNGQEPSATGIGQAFAALLVRRATSRSCISWRPSYSMIEGVDRRYVAVDDIRGHDENLATGVAGAARRSSASRAGSRTWATTSSPSRLAAAGRGDARHRVGAAGRPAVPTAAREEPARARPLPRGRRDHLAGADGVHGGADPRRPAV